MTQPVEHSSEAPAPPFPPFPRARERLGFPSPAAPRQNTTGDPDQKLQTNGMSPLIARSPPLGLSLSGRSFDAGDEPPIAPGVHERSRLLVKSNSNRRVGKGHRAGAKRGFGSQDVKGIVDPAPKDGQEPSSPLLANDSLSTYGSAAAEPGPGEGSVNASGES